MDLYANVLRSGGLSAVLIAVGDNLLRSERLAVVVGRYANVLRSGLSAVLIAVENLLRSGRLAVVVGVYANVLRSGLTAVPTALRVFLL